jgi:hypothetical protein
VSTQTLTTQELQIVYQSNEPAPVSGLYAVVENKTVERRVKVTGPLEPHQPKILHLNAGDLFPTVEGYSVVWRLISGDQ